MKIMQVGFHIFFKRKKVNFIERANCKIQKKKPERFFSKVVKHPIVIIKSITLGLCHSDSV